MLGVLPIPNTLRTGGPSSVRIRVHRRSVRIRCDLAHRATASIRLEGQRPLSPKTSPLPFRGSSDSYISRSNSCRRNCGGSFCISADSQSCRIDRRSHQTDQKQTRISLSKTLFRALPSNREPETPSRNSHKLELSFAETLRNQFAAIHNKLA